MIRQNANDSFIVVISILVYSVVIVFWPSQLFGGELSTAIACFVHAVFFNLMAYNFSRYCKNPYFLQTPLALSCLLLIIYLGVPFLKYYGEARFVELDVALHFRLFGLLVICASIFMILKLYANNWIQFYLRSVKEHDSVGSLFVPFMYTLFGVSTFYLITWGILTDSSLSPAKIIFTISGYYIALYYFAFFGAKNRELWNALLFVCGGLAITYYSGQRFAILFAVLLLLFARISRIRSHKKRKSLVLLSVLAIPLAFMMILGPLTEITKTRYGGVNLFFELQRTDFSDFVGAASEADYKANVFTGLYTSFLWAVPGRFIDKEKLDWSMEPFYKTNNWRSSNYREGYTKNNIDYIDSLFSNGAMVGGFAGAFLFPLVWYGFFTLILSRLKKKLLLSFYLASIPSMLAIEIAFWIIIPTIRDWILISAILFVSTILLSSLRPLNRRVTHRRVVKTPGTSRHTMR